MIGRVLLRKKSKDKIIHSRWIYTLHFDEIILWWNYTLMNLYLHYTLMKVYLVTWMVIFVGSRHLKGKQNNMSIL